MPVGGAREYYAAAEVRGRIAEYCGRTNEHGLTCAYVSELAPPGCVTWATTRRYSTDRLPQLLDRGWDLPRALRDRSSLIVYFAIEPAT